MSQVPLPNQMERCGEKQRHECACYVVPQPVRKEHCVFCLVNDGIHRIHHHAESESQTSETPAVSHTRCRVTADCYGGELCEHDSKIQPGRNVRRDGCFIRNRRTWRSQEHNDGIWQTGLRDTISKPIEKNARAIGMFDEGRRTNLFWHPFCRINAAFHLATERRIYAAAKNCVVRPVPFHLTIDRARS